MVKVVGLLLAFGALVGVAHSATLRFDETQIEAEVQKPEVTVFVSRENLSKAFDLDLERGFLERVIASVEEAPF